MTFESEFFEMAQALEENAEMIQAKNKLSDAQVRQHSRERERERRGVSFLQKRALSHLSTHIPSFKNLPREIASKSEAFDQWVLSNDVGAAVPTVWESTGEAKSDVATAMNA